MLHGLATCANDGLRMILRGGLVVAGSLQGLVVRGRIRRYPRTQLALRNRYQVLPETPMGEPGRWPAPPPPLARLSRSFRVGAFAVAAPPERAPWWPAGLVAPAGHRARPAIAALAETHGPAAVRLWLLALCNPGLLYGSSAQALAAFLGELYDDWQRAARLVHEYGEAPEQFHPSIRRVAYRLVSHGWRERFRNIAWASGPPPVEVWLPGLTGYTCKNDATSLEVIRNYLPPERFRFVPLGAEVTVPQWERGELRFLPLLPGLLYEFLPEKVPADPRFLLSPWQLEVGRSYAMVISDAQGPRRPTEKWFLCRQQLEPGVPDLVSV